MTSTVTVDWQAVVEATPWSVLVCDGAGAVQACNDAGTRFLRAYAAEAGVLPTEVTMLRQAGGGLVALGDDFFDVHTRRQGAHWVWTLARTTPQHTRQLIQEQVSDQLMATARHLSQATDTLTRVGRELTAVASSTVSGVRRVDALAQQLDHSASDAAAQSISLWRDLGSLVGRGVDLSAVVEKQVAGTTDDLQGLDGMNRNLLRMATGLELLAKQASVLSVNGQIEAGRSNNATLRVIAGQMVDMAKRSGSLARDMQEILTTAQNAIPATIGRVETLAEAVHGLRKSIEELRGAVGDGRPGGSGDRSMDEISRQVVELLGSSRSTESCVSDAVEVAGGLSTLGSQLGMVAARLRDAEHLEPSDVYRVVTMLHLVSDELGVPTPRSAPVGIQGKRPADVIGQLEEVARSMTQRIPGLRAPRRPDGPITPTQVFCYAADLLRSVRTSLQHRGETVDLYAPPVQGKTPNDVYGIASTLRLRWQT